MNRIIEVLIVYIFISSVSFSQGEGNFWYFGANAGLNFNNGSPVPVFDGQLNTAEGCTSVSDRSGNLLFYSDGIRVWDRTHTLMPNGNGMLGNPSATQSAIIVPKPGTYIPTLKFYATYYIVTVDVYNGANGVKYSEVNMLLNGGLGDVTTKNVNLYGTTTTEKITVALHANKCDFWVIGKPVGTNELYSYLINDTGFAAQPVVSTCSQVTGAYLGTLKVSPDNTMLAMVHPPNLILFDFDNASGTLTERWVETGIGAMGYSAEFSPDNNVLYRTTLNDANIYQYDLTVASNAAFTASRQSIGTGTGGGYVVGGIQLASDNKIYIINHNSAFLNVIHNPNGLGAACNYQQNAVNLSPRSAKLCLPAFPSFFNQAKKQIEIENTCFEDQTRIYLNDTSNLISIQWLVVEQTNPMTPVLYNNNWGGNTVQLPNPGTYYVAADLGYSCFHDTIYDTFSITSINPLNLGNDTSLCYGDSLILDAGAGFDFYLWENGNTSRYDTVRASKTDWCQVSKISDNLVVNGDFEFGNVGFSSQYNVGNASNTPQGSYFVGPESDGWFSTCGDHTTGSLTGNMMIVDAACGSNGVPGGADLWCQNLTVAPNTNYVFSAWISNVSTTNAAQIGFFIDGVQVGPTLGSVNPTCTWDQYYQLWNSGASTGIQLCIRELTYTCGGADFAIDDIYFAQLCSKSDSIDVAIMTDSVKIDGVVTDALCKSDRNGEILVNASGSYGSGYDYRIESSAFQDSSNVYEGLGAGSYLISVIDEIGCYNDTVFIVNEPDTLLASNVSIKNLRCYGFSDGKIVMTATGGTRPYSFLLNGSVSSSNDSIFDNLPPGVYTSEVVDANGCINAIGLGVFEPSPIVLSSNISDTCVYPSANVQLSAIGGSLIVQNNYTYYWDDVPNTPNLTITPSSDTVIYVYAQDDSLCYSDTLEIKINLIPQLDFIEDLADSCQPHSVNFTASILNNITPNICSWDFGDGNSGDNCVNESNVYTSPGYYTVSYEVTTDKGCVGIAKKSNLIQVYPNPYADFTFSPENVNILNPIYQFENLSTLADSVVWKIQGVDTLFDYDVKVKFPDAPPGDSYQVCLEVYSDHKCFDYVCKEVVVEDAYYLFVPNSFTPNGDGMNEIFGIYINGVKPETFSFLIFDKWGTQVKELNSINDVWDGTFNGQPLPTDVYIWKLKAESYLGNDIELINKTGTITLIR